MCPADEPAQHRAHHVPISLRQQCLSLWENLPLHGARREDGHSHARPFLVVTDAEHTRRLWIIITGERLELNSLCGDPILGRWRRDEDFEGLSYRVVGGKPATRVDEANVALVVWIRGFDLPTARIAVVRAAELEEIGGEEIRVGAAPWEGGGRDYLHVFCTEEGEEGRRVELAEAAAERAGRADGAAEGGVAAGGADEAREGREAEEDRAEEVFAEISYSGGGGRRRRRGYCKQNCTPDGVSCDYAGPLSCSACRVWLVRR